MTDLHSGAVAAEYSHTTPARFRSLSCSQSSNFSLDRSRASCSAAACRTTGKPALPSAGEPASGCTISPAWWRPPHLSVLLIILPVHRVAIGFWNDTPASVSMAPRLRVVFTAIPLVGRGPLTVSAAHATDARLALARYLPGAGLPCHECRFAVSAPISAEARLALPPRHGGSRFTPAAPSPVETGSMPPLLCKVPRVRIRCLYRPKKVAAAPAVVGRSTHIRFRSPSRSWCRVSFCRAETARLCCPLRPEPPRTSLLRGVAATSSTPHPEGHIVVLI